MSGAPGPGDRLRALLGDPQLTVAPGCYDAVTARLVRAYGFPAGYVSGATVSAIELGQPDLGFAGAAEMLQVISRVVGALGPLPVIADADAGFGDEIHVADLVRRYERAGVAALHLEDQALPKRCGHMDGKRLVTADVAASRIRAAVAARTDLVVIARTDALSVEGLAAALDRASTFVEAGADAVFVEGLRSVADIAAAHRQIDAPLVVSLSEAGGPITLTLRQLGDNGTALALVPVAGLLAALSGYRGILTDLQRRGIARPTPQLPWSELNDLLGLPALVDFQNAVEPSSCSIGQ